MSDPRGNAQLLYNFERTQLERDIGLFVLTTRKLEGTNTNSLATTANQVIDQWVNNSSGVLTQVTGANVDQIAGAARLSNPFT